MLFKTALLSTLIVGALADKFIKLPLTVHHATNSSKRDIKVPGKDEPVTVQNEVSYYAVTVSLGTPGQEISVLLDTGSSDLWVPSEAAANGSSYFTPSESSTYHELPNTPFYIQYGDGTYAEGSYVTDELSLASAFQIPNFEFGYATSSNSTATFGIGYKTNEAIDLQESPYNNLLYRLKSQNLIDVEAFSLYLDSEDSTTGSIIFGGIDKAKYSGDLVALDIVQEGGQYSEFIITVDSVTFQGNTVQDGGVALFDSGTTTGSINSEIFYSIVDYTNAEYETNVGYRFEYAGVDLTTIIDISFNGVDIKVPLSSFVWSDAAINNNPNVGDVNAPYDLSGSEYAYLNIFPADPEDGYIYGDVFLRYAYVVFNLEANTLSIAQAKYTDETDIVPITN